MSDRFAELRDYFDDAPYAKLLGMRVLELGNGYSKITLPQWPETGDWPAGGFRGLVMSLADQAFGTATNSLGSDRQYVAIQLAVAFVSEPAPGETLVAEGRVDSLRGEQGWADIVVQSLDGRIIAKATGAVLALPKR